MDEIKNIVQEYEVNIQDIGQGFKLTSVAHPAGFSAQMDNCGSYDGCAIIEIGHPPCYFFLNSQGELVKVLKEDAGLLPQFFYSPDGEPWVCLTVYDPDKDIENIFPLFNRQSYTPPKPKREGALGAYRGNIGQNLYFASGTEKIKQTPWTEKNVPGKTKTIKVPKDYKWASTYIFEDALHLLEVKSEEEFDLGDFLNGIKPKEEMPVKLKAQHAILRTDGEIVQQREFMLTGVFDTVEIVHLSFTEKSTFLTLDMLGNIRWIEVDANGQTKESLLHCIHQEFFGITGFVWLPENSFLLTFTTEEGNGWLIVKAGELLSCYIGKKNIYKDAISGHEIKMPFENKSIVSACVKTTDNGYCIGFYEMVEAHERRPAIYFLNNVV